MFCAVDSILFCDTVPLSCEESYFSFRYNSVNRLDRIFLILFLHPFVAPSFPFPPSSLFSLPLSLPSISPSLSLQFSLLFPFSLPALFPSPLFPSLSLFLAQSIFPFLLSTFPLPLSCPLINPAERDVREITDICI